MLKITFEQNQAKILAASNLKELDDIYRNSLAAMGIESFAFTHYTQEFSSAKQVCHSLCANPIQGWHDHFIEYGYEEIDPVGKRVENSIIPIAWDLNKELSQAQGKQKNLFAEALDYGLHSGISVPIHGLCHRSAILVIHHNNSQHPINTLDKLAIYSHHLSLYYYQRVIDLLQEAQTLDIHLTAREKECLLFTAKNKKPIEIAEKLNITERTVNFHIDNANNKLGTRNKHQSVAKAIYMSLLDL